MSGEIYAGLFVIVAVAKVRLGMKQGAKVYLEVLSWSTASLDCSTKRIILYVK